MSADTAAMRLCSGVVATIGGESTRGGVEARCFSKISDLKKHEHTPPFNFFLEKHEPWQCALFLDANYLLNTAVSVLLQ
jgi:hypothetical protein